MYFLVNASPPQRLDVATSNFADALVSSKAGICDCERLESSLHLLWCFSLSAKDYECAVWLPEQLSHLKGLSPNKPLSASSLFS